MLRGGPGTPVIVCNGFLSENRRGWAEWKSLIDKRDRDSPVYRIHWGAKELKDLGILGQGALKFASSEAIKQAEQAATKAGAKKLAPLGPILRGTDFVKNPWHVARTRADKTGAIVADVLA